MDIIVIGGGIIGLTSAITLRQAKHHVTVWARDLSPHTTSDVAAALWYPYLVEPADKVAAWGRIAYERFRDDATHPERGVRWRAGVLELSPRPLSDDALPAWRTEVDQFRRARPEELPAGYADGYVFDAPVIVMPTYLPFLQQTFLAQGGEIERRAVHDVAEAFAVAPIVVNCTGLGSRSLVSDATVYAVRGQVVRIRLNATREHLRTMTADDGPQGLVYIIPRIDDVVLGGVNTVDDERLAIDAQQTESIIARCREFAPKLGTIDPADIIQVACGLRPARHGGVRVEYEQPAQGQHLIHNYGHGGAGVTLSWGCAAAVADMVHHMKD
jgi:D-amino-acid oxidase